MTGYEFETGEGWTSALSLPPKTPSSQPWPSGMTGGCVEVFRTAVIDEGESECVRVELDEGDSVRLAGGKTI